jgi:hypothetical protein
MSGSLGHRYRPVLRVAAAAIALLEARGATLWIEHDKALADTLRKAPEYYD